MIEHIEIHQEIEVIQVLMEKLYTLVTQLYKATALSQEIQLLAEQGVLKLVSLLNYAY